MNLCPESMGNITNFLSVDVSCIQEFACYSHSTWATPLEMLVCSCMLYYVMGSSALFGLLVMGIALVFGMRLGKKLEKIQEKTLALKDERMQVISEILHAIRIVKFFAWEDMMVCCYCYYLLLII